MPLLIGVWCGQEEGGVAEVAAEAGLLGGFGWLGGRGIFGCWGRLRGHLYVFYRVKPCAVLGQATCGRNAHAVEYLLLAQVVGEADCGLSLIQNESFASYCEQKNAELGAMASGSYEQYVYGQVSVAQYRLGKKTEAVITAFEAVGSSFPKNNAVVALCLTAKAENDGETLNKILAKMNELESGLSATDKAYFDELKKVIWG